MAKTFSGKLDLIVILASSQVLDQKLMLRTSIFLKSFNRNLMFLQPASMIKRITVLYKKIYGNKIIESGNSKKVLTALTDNVAAFAVTKRKNNTAWRQKCHAHIRTYGTTYQFRVK